MSFVEPATEKIKLRYNRYLSYHDSEETSLFILGLNNPTLESIDILRLGENKRYSKKIYDLTRLLCLKKSYAVLYDLTIWIH